MKATESQSANMSDARKPILGPSGLMGWAHRTRFETRMAASVSV